jgi:hypothetical protein
VKLSGKFNLLIRPKTKMTEQQNGNASAPAQMHFFDHDSVIKLKILISNMDATRTIKVFGHNLNKFYGPYFFLPFDDQYKPKIRHFKAHKWKIK